MKMLLSPHTFIYWPTTYPDSSETRPLLNRSLAKELNKINDTVRSIYHNKCNKHDACKEAMLALKRIEHLQDVERQPHQYTKKKDEYWEADIFEQRRKRPRLCVASTQDDEPPITEGDVDTMTIPELKTKLKEMGIATKCRREDKLREILRKAISDSTND